MSKYDCVVIGAGTGGLSAALTMASAGKKTLVVEQHNLPGGCSTSFIRGRFEFDASLHEYCGIGEPGNWGLPGKLMMEDYKLNIEWLPAKELYRCIGTTRSGHHIDMVLPVGKEAAARAMDEAVPGSYEAMYRFYDLMEECDEAYTYTSDKLTNIDKKTGYVKTNDLYYMKRWPNFLRYAEQPFNTVLRKLGMPEDAIDIMDIYWGYIGTDYETLSFVHQGWMIYTYITKKPANCKYNSHGMTVAAVERLRELGSDLWLNVLAEKVVSDENGKIIGVQTSAGFVETNYVIADMNPQTAYTKLLDKRIKVPERSVKMANASTHGVRIFNVYLGLNKSIEELGIKDYTYFIPGKMDTVYNLENSKSYEENTYGGAVVYNVVNPDASPKGTTIMTFTTCYTAEVWDKFTQRNYVKAKQHAFANVMKNFEDNTGIIIHDCIEEIEMASPWTFANYLKTPMGGMYGYQFNRWDTLVSRMMSIAKDQPIPGFATCGASGARGDGYSQTYLNGNDIGKLILKEMAEEGN